MPAQQFGRSISILSRRTAAPIRGLVRDRQITWGRDCLPREPQPSERCCGVQVAQGDASMWNQVYNPFGNAVLSTIAAALPVVTLLALIASNKAKAPVAAIIALLVAILVAIFAFTMPAGLALRAVALGAVTGFFPIGWIILNVLFLYRLTVERGSFETLQTTIGGVTADRRLQLLLIAFSFGAFFEGASGFGTPVAVTGAILIGLGFSPLAASGLSLIANTAPVAYGALGAPIIGLEIGRAS